MNGKKETMEIPKLITKDKERYNDYENK